jgi:flagellar motor switch protein FliN
MDIDLETAPATTEKNSTTVDSRLTLFGHVEVTLSIEFGGATLSVAELMALKTGSTISLNQRLADAVTLSLNGLPFAQGELVVVDEHFGVRIERVL